MANTEKKNKLNIELPEEVSEGVYSNLAVITQQVWNFFGLLIFFLAILILLNEEHTQIFKNLVYICLFLLPFTRLIKSLMYAISNNYGWLYIILYLCTLEILPLVVLGKIFRELF